MSRFFIDRPIFAWVIALFIILAGIISLTQLPVAYYPKVAPTQIMITVKYPGATAAMVDESVVSVIQNELNGVDNLLYMESGSESNGVGQITLTFKPGTNPDVAQVEVQNQLSRATPRLPQEVNKQGIVVDKSNANILLVGGMFSEDPDFDEIQLGDYVARYIVPEIQRIEGVGSVNLFGTEHAMRIWMDMDKLAGLDLTPEDIIDAIKEQNAQVSSGGIGLMPNRDDQAITASVFVRGQLSDVSAFKDVILIADIDGSTVRLKDVARVEMGAASYARVVTGNGQKGVAFAVMPAPGSNALSTANSIYEKMEELSAFFPEGVRFEIANDYTRFIRISIQKVIVTLAEAMALVFLVMLLFLQNLRYTLIPTVVVPVALLGTLSVLYTLGFSINVLSMFAMVLVIGILVDDAIVVVENIERLMAQENLSPRDATIKAMGQIVGAIIGVTVVLVSVFIPMAYFIGAVGNIYREFSVTMVVSILFSAFLSLSLTPAMCASLIKPLTEKQLKRKAVIFGWFNRFFNNRAKRYQTFVEKTLSVSGRFLIVYAVILAVVALLFIRLPTSFLPDEDQGMVFAVTQLQPGATMERSTAVIRQVEDYFLQQPQVSEVVSVVGLNFFGSGQNMANSFIALKPWDGRHGYENSSFALVEKARRDLSKLKEASVFPLNPPAISELGTGSGYTFRIQDRGELGHARLLEAAQKLLQLASNQPEIGSLRIESLPDAPELEVNIDRDKAYALGIDFATLNKFLSASLGSAYVNDFPSHGRMQRVIVQADVPNRMQPEDVLQLQLRNMRGDMVPLSTFATVSWKTGPVLLVRYDGYRAIRLAGTAAPGFSTGEAMDAIEMLMEQLPRQIAISWHALSREEKSSNRLTPLLLTLSLVAVFLSLAALYESWSVPFAVLLVVPLGVLGAVLATTLADLSNDVYFKVGLITVMGLTAKNAILIVQFARELQASGSALKEAILTACRLRFRPIIMTSMAFTMGVLPLVVSSGAGSASKRAVGTGVMGGMITATVLAIFFIPIFYYLINRSSELKREDNKS